MKGIFETIEPGNFFNRDAQIVAKDLLGKVLQHKVDDIWVSGMESINQIFLKQQCIYTNFIYLHCDSAVVY